MTDEAHLGLTRKDNYIMWVSATGSRINVMKIGQIPDLHRMNMMNNIMIIHPGNELLITLRKVERHIVLIQVFCFLTSAQPVSAVYWLIATAVLEMQIDTKQKYTFPCTEFYQR